ncbi:MAG: IPTL-CTERM sorting domain-containing protein, partial [Candidatus Zixiibacteriota bacterium]
DTAIQDLIDDLYNIPYIGIYNPGVVPPVPITITTTTQTFAGVSFDYPIDDDLDGTPEGWMAIVEVNEDQINWTGEYITIEGSPGLALQYVYLSSGAISRNYPGTGEIPTLTEWGLIIFTLLLLGWMTWMIIRRRQSVRIGI